MALGGQSLAGVARVAYETVGLSEFQRDTQRAEQVYRSSTGTKPRPPGHVDRLEEREHGAQ